MSESREWSTFTAESSARSGMSFSRLRTSPQLPLRSPLPLMSQRSLAQMLAHDVWSEYQQLNPTYPRTPPESASPQQRDETFVLKQGDDGLRQSPVSSPPPPTPKARGPAWIGVVKAGAAAFNWFLYVVGIVTTLAWFHVIFKSFLWSYT